MPIRRKPDESDLQYAARRLAASRRDYETLARKRRETESPEERAARRAQKAEYAREYRKKRRAAGLPLPERSKEEYTFSDWWRKYRLRPADVVTLFKSQAGVCPICGSPIALPGPASNTMHVHVDHCHSTGRVRGLLCNQCNLMLGHAKDSIDTLRRAIAYLQP